MSGHPEPVVWDSASAAEREAWVTHVDACAECRARWLADDPSLMFALLAREPIPDAVLVSGQITGEAEFNEVYFTDARGLFPPSEPNFPVLWLVKGKENVPWGQRVHGDAANGCQEI